MLGQDTTGTNRTRGGTGTVTALFRDRDSAERAYRALRDRGYTEQDVSLVMTDDTRKREFGSRSEARESSELGSKAAQGTGVGAAVGGTAGAIAAAIATVGSTLAIPGLGLVIAGPVAAALAGAGAGGLAGSIVGALVGSGIPEDRARTYETGVKEGGILLSVKPRSAEDARYLEESWTANKGDVQYH